MSQKNLAQPKSYTRKKIQNFSYGLNDAIGKGYSSQVYKGRNDNTEEPVAVKVIDLKMLKCEINRTLLASQIEILKSMRNIPHVLTLHEVYTTKNNTYIITELCQTDLSSKIKKGLSETEAFTYMNQIIEGYSYIYEKSLIHRDLKPANLLITKNNHIKIADFGFGVKAEEVLKPSKYNVGSPLYMAPESLKRNQYSFKSDIWALGIIFFEMLTGDTPWRAKNEKELIKKIEGEKISEILPKQRFSQLAKQFLTKALQQDKSQRLGPDELIKYNFKTQQFGSILGEKQMNTALKMQRFESIVCDASSPKNIGRSIQKRIFNHEKSDKKLQPKFMNSTQSIQNVSVKNIENQGRVNYTQETPTHHTTTNTENLSKQDKKFISKLLIAEVHFCRFLFKLLGRIKQSLDSGLFKDNLTAPKLFKAFTEIIEHKITHLKEFEGKNFLDIQYERYDQYKKTTDFKKLVKIAKDYYDRYSTQLTDYWKQKQFTEKTSQPSYRDSIEEVTKTINFLIENLLLIEASEVKTNSYSSAAQSEFLASYNKDIIILDYLITCKQLLQMIEKQIKLTGAQNFEKFAKKSRIQEIVEGSTSQINMDLYEKIMERGRMVLGSKKT